MTPKILILIALDNRKHTHTLPFELPDSREDKWDLNIGVIRCYKCAAKQTNKKHHKSYGWMCLGNHCHIKGSEETFWLCFTQSKLECILVNAPLNNNTWGGRSNRELHNFQDLSQTINWKTVFNSD